MSPLPPSSMPTSDLSANSIIIAPVLSHRSHSSHCSSDCFNASPSCLGESMAVLSLPCPCPQSFLSHHPFLSTPPQRRQRHLSSSNLFHSLPTVYLYSSISSVYSILVLSLTYCPTSTPTSHPPKGKFCTPPEPFYVEKLRQANSYLRLFPLSSHFHSLARKPPVTWEGGKTSLGKWEDVTGKVASCGRMVATLVKSHLLMSFPSLFQPSHLLPTPSPSSSGSSNIFPLHFSPH